MNENNKNIALFKSVTVRDYDCLVSIDKVLEGIQRALWKELVQPVREVTGQIQELQELVIGMEAKGKDSPQYSQQVLDNMKAQIKVLEERKVELKHQVPAYMPAGHCSQGKKNEDFKLHSGLMGIDADLDSAEKAVRLRDEAFNQFPWIRAAYRSLSGDGVHFLVSVEPQTIESWARTYRSVMRYFKRHAHVEVDGSCKNIARVLCISQDEDMRLRTPAEVAVYSVEAEEAEFRQMLEAQAAASFQPDDAPYADAFLPDGSKYTPGDGRRLLNHYERSHSLRDEGSRHNNLLTVLAALRKNGCTDAEYQEVSGILLSEYPAPGFSQKEIENAINWAAKIQADPACWRLRQNVNVSNYHYRGGFPAQATTATAKEVTFSLEGHKLPTFSDKIHLPDFLKRVMKLGENDEQRDVLILSMITYLGALMPMMEARYGLGSRRYYPNLILTVIGRSTSRKSVALMPNAMMDDLNRRFEEENRQREQQYEQEKLEYDQQCSRKGKKAKGEDKPRMKCPTEPQPIYFEQMLSTSRSQLVMNLVPSQEYGAYAIASEIDELINALGKDYGGFSPDIRAFSEHEKVGHHYKGDKRQIVARCPKFSIVLTGTEQQWGRLVPSYEDGMGNRLVPYHMTGTSGWRSQFCDDDDEDTTAVFSEMAPQIVEMYDFLRQFPARVKLTEEQRNAFDDFFDGRTKSLGTDLNDVFDGIIHRGGVTALRMCIILSGVRKFDERNEANVVYCHDADFDMVMTMMDVLLDHAFFMTRLSPNSVTPVELGEAAYVTSTWMNAMPDEFEKKDVLRYVAEHHLDRSEASISRDLKKLCDKGLLKKTKHGVYAKVKGSNPLLPQGGQSVSPQL